MAQETLLERRKRLKLSRADVAKASDLSQAQIMRIENGGPRTTEEETAKLAGILDKLEADGSPS